jgi:site-specific recombinase XerD
MSTVEMRPNLIKKQPQRLPVVLTVEEVKRVLARMDGQDGLMAELLYGADLRLLECVRLRVKDVDFGYRQITVRDGKGEKDRMTMLPQTVIEPLRVHLEKVQVIHEHDVEEGHGEVYLPYALARKYPNAAREWGWQYVFPACGHSVAPPPVPA